jgi:hypothetical protein
MTFAFDESLLDQLPDAIIAATQQLCGEADGLRRVWRIRARAGPYWLQFNQTPKQ